MSDQKAILVLEIDPDRIDEAVSGIQRYILGSDVPLLGADMPDRGRLFTRTMHVAIEDKAEEVLKIFEKAPVIDGPSC